MGIHRQSRVAEGDVEDHVGGLTADAGQGLQRCAVVRHLTSVPFQQQAAGLDDVFTLAVEEPDGLDMLPQTLFPQGQHGRRGVCDGKEPGSGLVDPLIGRLGREDNGHH